MDKIKRSATVTLAFLYAFALLYAATLVAAPYLFPLVKSFEAATDTARRFLFVALYISSIPAVAVIYLLSSLLLSVRAGAVFDEANVKRLKLVTAACFVFAAIVAAAGVFFVTLFAVAAAAVFIGLVMAVVKRIFEYAYAVKAENGLEI